MADFSKRAKTARKQANKRAKAARKTADKRTKAARKAAAKTSPRTRAQALIGILVALSAAAATARLLKGKSREAKYAPEPDNLPNQPDRPAGTTPMPTAT